MYLKYMFIEKISPNLPSDTYRSHTLGCLYVFHLPGTLQKRTK